MQISLSYMSVIAQHWCTSGWPRTGDILSEAHCCSAETADSRYFSGHLPDACQIGSWHSLPAQSQVSFWPQGRVHLSTQEGLWPARYANVSIHVLLIAGSQNLDWICFEFPHCFLQFLFAQLYKHSHAHQCPAKKVAPHEAGLIPTTGNSKCL